MDNSKCGMQKNSDQVDALLYLFSDLVGNKISSGFKFLEYITQDNLFLFKTA